VGSEGVGEDGVGGRDDVDVDVDDDMMDAEGMDAGGVGVGVGVGEGVGECEGEEGEEGEEGDEEAHLYWHWNPYSGPRSTAWRDGQLAVVDRKRKGVFSSCREDVD
jgi:hypothetical protein